MHTAECVAGDHVHEVLGDRHEQVPVSDRGHDGADHSGHAHGRIDPAVLRTRLGLQAVGSSLAVLAVTSVVQVVIYVVSGSVALLADLIHNGSDALTAVPIGAAFLLRSRRAEALAGRAVVATVLISAVVAAAVAVDRLVHPHTPGHLVALAAAGIVGVIGNAVAARIRSRAGRALDSPALIADGAHARTDALVSFGVVVSAGLVGLGLRIADPIIALVVTVVILRITVESWHTVNHHGH